MSPRKKVTEDQQVPELETVPDQSQQAESPKEPASVPRRPPSSAADILILNDQERGFTPEDSEDVKWNYLSGAMHTHKILTGVVSGIETLENGNIIAQLTTRASAFWSLAGRCSWTPGRRTVCRPSATRYA